MRQIMRHQAPGTAGVQHILETLDHLTHRVLAGLAPDLCWRQQAFSPSLGAHRAVERQGDEKRSFVLGVLDSLPPLLHFRWAERRE